MWFTLLVPLLTSIFGKEGVIGTYLSTKQQIKQKEQDASLELAKANLELIKQQGVDAVESEKNKLQATGQGFKYVTFVLINIPVIVICIFPNRGKEIFANISLIPAWYAQLYAAIYGIVWGLPVASGAMSSIFSAIQDAVANRRDYALQKLDKKAYFAALKNVKGVVTDADVKLQDAVIDELNKG